MKLGQLFCLYNKNKNKNFVTSYIWTLEIAVTVVCCQN